MFHFFDTFVFWEVVLLERIYIQKTRREWKKKIIKIPFRLLNARAVEADKVVEMNSQYLQQRKKRMKLRKKEQTSRHTNERILWKNMKRLFQKSMFQFKVAVWQSWMFLKKFFPTLLTIWCDAVFWWNMRAFKFV